LEEVWARSWYPLFQQPLGEIRDYFGEKVAFYFAWLQFYCQWLIFLAIGGVLLWFWQIATPPHPKIDVDILPFCGIVVAVWATLFLEFWKRRESTLRAEWGMTNFVQKEQPRPEFYGERMRSPVDGTLIKHDPFYKRLPRFFLSQLVIGTLIGYRAWFRHWYLLLPYMAHQKSGTFRWYDYHFHRQRCPNSDSQRSLWYRC